RLGRGLVRHRADPARRRRPARAHAALRDADDHGRDDHPPRLAGGREGAMARWLRIALALAAVLAVALCVVWPGSGVHEGPGEIAAPRVPDAGIGGRARRQAEARRGPGAAPRADEKQILFGDLHVHTTFSTDAFFRSLPFVAGEGLHPPADACDFARVCSQLDFWSINDHAEAITPARWKETQESIRQCNAAAGDPANPDVVAFLGW